VTIRESVELILKLVGRKNARVVYDPSKPTSIQKRVVDLTKARARLGFQPKVSFEEGLERTIEWYRSTVASSQVRG
jgi:nucleoside-diphosphate-sugar epimerase